MSALPTQRLVFALSTAFLDVSSLQACSQIPGHPDFPLQDPEGLTHRCAPCRPTGAAGGQWAGPSPRLPGAGRHRHGLPGGTGPLQFTRPVHTSPTSRPNPDPEHRPHRPACTAGPLLPSVSAGGLACVGASTDHRHSRHLQASFRGGGGMGAVCQPSRRPRCASSEAQLDTHRQGACSRACRFLRSQRSLSFL